MCGICGILYYDKHRSVEPALLQAMSDRILHRGPDDQGQLIRANVGLAMRRLSIIDVATGHQPIFNEDESMAIVYNGEIFNHRQVRSELEARGHVFRTQADTEVILHAYEEYGVNCPQKLNGMFALAIWDGKRERLFLARDRLGVKPLYYYHDEQQLIFGSELKALTVSPALARRVNLKALDNFLTFEYIPAPLSIFENVFKLPQAHYLLWESGRITIKPYWQLTYQAATGGEDELAERLRLLLQDATKIRLMSEVPLGAFLSGGLDSSAIVAMMAASDPRPVKTFSIGFANSSYNELPYARSVSQRFSTDHSEEIITPDALRLTERIVRQLDEPFGDFSVFPTLMVSEMARQQVTVVLSGDGGDEVLAGYDTYVADRLARRLGRLPGRICRSLLDPLVMALPPTEKKKGLINKSRRFLEGLRLPADLQHVRWMIFMRQQEKQALYTPELWSALREQDPYDFIREKFAACSSSAPLDQQEYVDIMTYLVDDILVKVDRMSMLVSLEARTPFLDYRVVEFCASLPPNLRLAGSQSKYLLKKAMQGILPEMILHRGKEGFSIPIKQWLKNELRPLMEEYLSPVRLKRAGEFQPGYVQKLMQEHLRGSENHSHRLWALMMYQMWRETHGPTST
jgi:asparagine synthase (glutamine-hydrolysing)